LLPDKPCKQQGKNKPEEKLHAVVGTDKNKNDPE
jgi:hypothetical protein